MQFVTYSKFENKLSKVIPKASNHSLYQIKLIGKFIQISLSLSYPGGNFNVNQLPNISISLSPLNSNQTNNLHVSTASSLHRVSSGFTRFKLSSISFGSHHVNSDATPLREDVGWRCEPSYLLSLHFIPGLITHKFAYMLDSLARVSRRDD
jgi:hypothetical protein